jgi:hypothetical protein
MQLFVSWTMTWRDGHSGHVARLCFGGTGGLTRAGTVGDAEFCPTH